MNTMTIPTPDEAAAAGQAVLAFRAFKPSSGPTRVRVAVPDSPQDVEVVVPVEALHLLVRILTHMANGDAVTVMPVQAELTTQKAAEIIGVSRPFLVKLLDDGIIPHRKVGTHRRVRAADLVEYQRQDDVERRAVLDELTSEGQEIGLGY